MRSRTCPRRRAMRLCAENMHTRFERSSSCGRSGGGGGFFSWGADMPRHDGTGARSGQTAHLQQILGSAAAVTGQSAVRARHGAACMPRIGASKRRVMAEADGCHTVGWHGGSFDGGRGSGAQRRGPKLTATAAKAVIMWVRQARQRATGRFASSPRQLGLMLRQALVGWQEETGDAMLGLLLRAAIGHSTSGATVGQAMRYRAQKVAARWTDAPMSLSLEAPLDAQLKHVLLVMWRAILRTARGKRLQTTASQRSRPRTRRTGGAAVGSLRAPAHTYPLQLRPPERWARKSFTALPYVPRAGAGDTDTITELARARPTASGHAAESNDAAAAAPPQERVIAMLAVPRSRPYTPNGLQQTAQYEEVRSWRLERCLASVGQDNPGRQADDAIFVISRMATAVRDWRRTRRAPEGLVPVEVVQRQLHRGILKTPLASSQGHWWRVRELGPAEATFVQEAMGYGRWRTTCRVLEPLLTDLQLRAAWGQSVHADVTAWAWQHGFPRTAAETPNDTETRGPLTLALVGSGAGMWALPYLRLHPRATVEYMCEPHGVMRDACRALMREVGSTPAAYGWAHEEATLQSAKFVHDMAVSISCAPFSEANRRYPKGVPDALAQLAGVIRLIEATRPWRVLIEQTGSLVKASRDDARGAYECILLQLRASGYRLRRWRACPARDFCGVMYRRRVFYLIARSDVHDMRATDWEGEGGGGAR